MNTFAKIRAAASAVILAVFAALCALEAAPRLDALAGDLLLRSGGTQPPEIVILAIDDASMEALGRFPWPRSVYAEALFNLADGGAAAVGIDVVFNEPSDEFEDELLMEAIAYAGNVILPVQVEQRVGRESNLSPEGYIETHGVNYPIPMLAAQAAGFGHINAQPDDWDGYIRRALGPYVYVGDDSLVLSFGEAIYRQYLAWAGQEAAADSHYSYFERPYIRFAGAPGTVTRYPFYAALDPESIDPAEFEGKIVLIGAFTQGLSEDSFFTPASGVQRMYGVEIHANIIANMLAAQPVLPAPAWYNITALLAVCAGAAVCFWRVRRALVKLGIFALACALFSGAWYLAFCQGRLASLCYGLMALLLLYLADVVVSYTEEFAEKRRMSAMFGKYLAPQVLEKLIAEGEAALGLGGEERELTALFVDIRGFTPMSEVLSPSQVVQILNEYLTLATDAVFEYGGTLDKYIGDAAMALYNVPYEQDNHALRAVKTALYMQRHSADMYDRLLEKYGRGIQFGVGINTGVAVVGNIGSPTRMDYTAIGDVVNVAARLESNSKGGQILISEAVYECVKDEIDAQPLGGLKVKGRASEVQAYLVTGLIEKA